MKTVPFDVIKYWESPEFTEDSVPEHLLESHQTKSGTWARILVLEGRLQYQILGPSPELTELSPDQPGIVEPTIPHRVEPLGPVRFRLEFYR